MSSRVLLLCISGQADIHISPMVLMRPVPCLPDAFVAKHSHEYSVMIRIAVVHDQDSHEHEVTEGSINSEKCSSDTSKLEATS